jgi:hypothetical protein
MKEPGQVPDPAAFDAEALAYAQAGRIHPAVESAIRADEAAKLRAENERLRKALRSSRETIIDLVRARGSEAEGVVEDWFDFIDAALEEKK